MLTIFSNWTPANLDQDLNSRVKIRQCKEPSLPYPWLYSFFADIRSSPLELKWTCGYAEWAYMNSSEEICWLTKEHKEVASLLVIYMKEKVNISCWRVYRWDKTWSLGARFALTPMVYHTLTLARGSACEESSSAPWNMTGIVEGSGMRFLLARRFIFCDFRLFFHLQYLFPLAFFCFFYLRSLFHLRDAVMMGFFVLALGHIVRFFLSASRVDWLVCTWALTVPHMSNELFLNKKEKKKVIMWSVHARLIGSRWVSSGWYALHSLESTLPIHQSRISLMTTIPYISWTWDHKSDGCSRHPLVLFGNGLQLATTLSDFAHQVLSIDQGRVPTRTSGFGFLRIKCRRTVAITKHVSTSSHPCS